MPRPSAGIFMFKREGDQLLVLLVHPGGPFWAKKDAGAWMIPKGEFDPGEDPEAAARREFEEELGVAARGELIPLGDIVQKSGKRVTAFALEGDLDVTAIKSNIVEMEWPPKSGKRLTFPEVDRAAWFSLAEARMKMLPSQLPLLERLVAAIS